MANPVAANAVANTTVMSQTGWERQSSPKMTRPAIRRNAPWNRETPNAGRNLPMRSWPRVSGAARRRIIVPCRRSATNTQPTVSTRKNANVTVYDGTRIWNRSAPRLGSPPSSSYFDTLPPRPAFPLDARLQHLAERDVLADPGHELVVLEQVPDHVLELRELGLERHRQPAELLLQLLVELLVREDLGEQLLEDRAQLLEDRSGDLLLLVQFGGDEAHELLVPDALERFADHPRDDDPEQGHLGHLL